MGGYGLFQSLPIPKTPQQYRVFRERLTAPLVTVELAFDRSFELEARDAEVLIQLRGQDVMWHKERLLNIGLQAVPAACRAIAWLDCDLVFEHSDWPCRALEALQHYSVIQLFSTVHEPRPTEPLGSTPGAGRKGTSVMRALESGADSAKLLCKAARRRHGICSGFAWAANREVLRKGLYDACILGGGNRAILCAQLGRFEDAVHYLRMSNHWRRHYRGWAERHQELAGSSVGYLPGRLAHLWHGSLRNRRYAERHIGLRRFRYDPRSDLALEQWQA